tara:strand:+ start:633 stop:776 length:144 start_codon:yes stop_codon:yes gene_type:complete
MGKQNQKLLKNIKLYEKAKAEQQESKIYRQKPVKRNERNKKTRVYST